MWSTDDSRLGPVDLIGDNSRIDIPYQHYRMAFPYYGHNSTLAQHTMFQLGQYIARKQITFLSVGVARQNKGLDAEIHIA